MNAKHMKRALGVTGLLALGACAASETGAGPRQAASDAPVELGHVAWERDYETARVRAGSQGRDLLMLFQEVPG